MGDFKVEPHSEMANYEEYLAKYILEDVLKLGPFDKLEKPDLQADGMGVEVTKAYDPWYNKSEGELEIASIAKLDGDEKTAALHLKKSIVSESGVDGVRVMLRIDQTKFGPIRLVSASGDLYKSRKPLLEKALSKKLDKLNSGNYTIFRTMGLFIYSLIELTVSESDKMSKDADLLAFLRGIQAEKVCTHSEYRGYDIIYVCSVPSAILVSIDMLTGETRRVSLNFSDYNDRLCQLSRKV